INNPYSYFAFEGISTDPTTGGFTSKGKVTVGSDTITNVDPAVIAKLSKGMAATRLGESKPEFFAAGTTISDLGVTSGQGFIKLVTGNLPASAKIANDGGLPFTFGLPTRRFIDTKTASSVSPGYQPVVMYYHAQVASGPVTAA